MLTTKNTGLVQGVPLEESTPKIRVKALRGFYDQNKEPRQPGDVIEVTERFAKYLTTTNKGVIVPGVEVVSVEDVPQKQLETATPEGTPAPPVPSELEEESSGGRPARGRRQR